MDRVILTLAGGCLGLLAGLLLWGRGEQPTRNVPGVQRERSAANGSTSGAYLAPVPPLPGQSPPASAAAELQERLAREIARAEVLAEEVRQLREELRERESGEAEGDVAPDAVAGSSTEGAVPKARREGGWLEEAALLGAGFHETEVEALRARFEEIELERLYLRDQATREGWVKKPRFRKKMVELNERYDALRGEYGDDGYDWILYASGRTNRVVTTLVMGDSPAERAGLETGDVFVAYAGTRIFDASELQRATKTHGAPGDTVAVDVLRDGEERRFYVPVGPLGIQLTPTREAPRGTR